MISPDSFVLSCYELAKYYHVDPAVFLDKPISEIRQHLYWTGKLNEAISEEQRAMQAERDE